MINIISSLKRITIFSQLSDDQLSRIIPKLSRKTLAEDEILFRFGDPGHVLYIVQKGQVEIFSTDDDGEKIVLETFNPGGSFGEMSLIDGHPRSANAIAAKPTNLLRLDRKSFEEIVTWWPELSLGIMADLTRKIRFANTNIVSLAVSLSRSNRQLTELNNLKSQFLGVVTHEMRTPLANIGFSLQLLSRYGLDNLTPEQQEEIAAIIKNTQSSKMMVDNLVAITSFLNKQGELVIHPVDFVQLVQDSLTVLQPLAENRGLYFRTQLPDESIYVEVDSERLQEAIYHLVHNAIKFTPESGDVLVKAWQDDENVNFEVLDTGVGVPEEKLPTLWDAFAQMADPVQRGTEGLGLGLTLVKYVANAHGGQVWAKSKKNKGSIFGFNIPLEEPKLNILA